MSNYTQATDFSAKDALPTGDSNKIIRGSDFDGEFSALATAVNSKADASSPTLTGSGTAVNLTVSGTLNATGTLQIGGVAVTSTAAELNILDGVTATTAEINYLDGVTSNIQTQIDSKVTLTDEQVQDIVGAMVTGNTETDITVTYQDVDGTIDFEVGNLAASKITSGTFADARIAESNVTQHEAAIDAGSVDGYDIVVDSGTPSGTDANTIYFVT